MEIIIYKPLISNSNIENILNYLINDLGFTPCAAYNIINAERAIINKIEKKQKTGGINYGF